MPKINLSDIQSATNLKFSDFEVTLPGGEVVLFVPVLRLPKVKRTELAEAFNVEVRAKVEESLDMYDLYRDAFRITAKHAGGFKKLEEAVGDDPAVWQELFTSYSEDTQAGEV